MSKHMYSTFLMKSGFVTNINYLDFLKEHMIQELLLDLEERCAGCSLKQVWLSALDKSHKTSLYLYFPSNHQLCWKTQNRTMITKIHGPFTGLHRMLQSFRAISLKCDCLILHPSCIRPEYCP
ncbi:hypothetical protein PAMP_019708 [Pampus punctatissimus]